MLDSNTYLPECVNLDPTCSYQTMLNNYEGGNVDLRVPYIGYSSESESYTAAGVAAYNALDAHIEKRLSHGFQGGLSYTYSHATDEQSGMGLFYNGNNPNNLRGGYGSSDFDRTMSSARPTATRFQTWPVQVRWRARRSTSGPFTARQWCKAASRTA